MFNAILNKSIANHIREVYGDFAWSQIENKIDVKNQGYIYNPDEQILLESLLDATAEVTNQSKEHLIE